MVEIWLLRIEKFKTTRIKTNAGTLRSCVYVCVCERVVGEKGGGEKEWKERKGVVLLRTGGI